MEIIDSNAAGKEKNAGVDIGDVSDSTWYVIWTLSGDEQRLYERMERDLDRELYRELWFPVRIERRKIGGEFRDVRCVLLPGYFFIDTDNIDEVFYSIRRIPEFVGILRRDGEFAPISERERLMIRRLSDEDGIVELSKGYLENGRLHILRGPLREFEQYITGFDKHKRKARVEVNLLGELRTLYMGIELVE